jgi:hypothetical protein
LHYIFCIYMTRCSDWNSLHSTTLCYLGIGHRPTNAIDAMAEFRDSFARTNSRSLFRLKRNDLFEYHNQGWPHSGLQIWSNLAAV